MGEGPPLESPGNFRQIVSRPRASHGLLRESRKKKLLSADTNTRTHTHGQLNNAPVKRELHAHTHTPTRLTLGVKGRFLLPEVVRTVCTDYPRAGPEFPLVLFFSLSFLLPHTATSAAAAAAAGRFFDFFSHSPFLRL